MTRYFHVVGTTQYEGTCKMHLFQDCCQLQKKRVQHFTWGDRDSTGVIESCELEALNVRRICKLCQRRAAK